MTVFDKRIQGSRSWLRSSPCLSNFFAFAFKRRTTSGIRYFSTTRRNLSDSRSRQIGCFARKGVVLSLFKTRSDADAEARRQKTLLEIHSREAIGLSPPREMSDFITARKKLAEYGDTISEAVKFRVDYFERIRRSGLTVAQLAEEVLAAKQRDGRAPMYLAAEIFFAA